MSVRKRSLSPRSVAHLAIAAFALLLGSQALAKDSIEVYLENRKGLDSFKKGNIDEAREHFGRAQAADPKKPELLFNQGVIQLDQKSLDQAEEGFSGAAKEASDAKNHELESRAYYNLGSTEATKGDSDGAIRSYLEGIDAAKEAKDPELEKELRKKIELLVQDQQQQQQETEKPGSESG